MARDLNEAIEESNRLVDVRARLKADLEYHQAEGERISQDAHEEFVDESYHAGYVEAMGNAVALLFGREVKLYSETFKDAT